MKKQKPFSYNNRANMKKAYYPFLLFIATVFLVSCSKESNNVVETTTDNTPDPPVWTFNSDEVELGTTDFDTFDIERDVSSEVTFDDIIVFDNVTKFGHVVFGKIFAASVGVYTGFLEYFVGTASAYTVDIGETDLNTLCVGNVNAGNTCHCYTSLLTLSLLMFGIFANDHYSALAFDDLAFFAHLLYRRFDFHK